MPKHHQNRPWKRTFQPFKATSTRPLNKTDNNNQTSEWKEVGMLISRQTTWIGTLDKSKTLNLDTSEILASIPNATSLLYTTIKWTQLFPQTSSENINVMEVLECTKHECLHLNTRGWWMRMEAIPPQHVYPCLLSSSDRRQAAEGGKDRFERQQCPWHMADVITQHKMEPRAD